MSARQHSRVRLFESGIRFIQQDTDIMEENMLSGVAFGAARAEQWGESQRQADFFDIKADLECLFNLTGAAEEFEFAAADHPALHPGRSARVVRAGHPIGWTGELHPALVRQMNLTSAPMLFELSVGEVFAGRRSAYRPVSKYPAVRRDIAVIVDRALRSGRWKTRSGMSPDRACVRVSCSTSTPEKTSRLVLRVWL